MQEGYDIFGNDPAAAAKAQGGQPPIGQAQGQPQQQPVDNSGRSAALPALQGISMGWGDEALAGALAAYGTYMPELKIGNQNVGGFPDNNTFKENYEGVRDAIREDTKQYGEENQGVAAAAEIAGGAFTGGAGLWKAGGKKAVQEAAKRGYKPDMETVKRLMQQMGIGGAEGAIYGAGQAEEVEDIPEKAVEGAQWGMAGGAVGGEAMHQGRRYFQKKSMLKDAIEADLKQGGTPDTALMKLSEDILGNSKVADDGKAVEAAAQGWGRGVINAVKRANPLERVQFNQMNKKAKMIMDNPESPERTWDVVGEAFMRRFNLVKKFNKDAGSDLESASKGLKGKSVSYTKPVQEFQKDLKEMGIELVTIHDGNAVTGRKIIPDFEGSDIEMLPAAEAVINNIVARMNKGDNIDAYDLHRLKKYIDENVSWGTSGEGLKGKTLAVLKRLRHNIDAELDSAFPAYNKANTEYGRTIKALDELQAVAGRQVDLGSDEGAAFIGQEARALLSNRQKRVRMYKAMKEMDNVAEEFGVKQYDNILRLAIYADELDDMFPDVRRRTSIAGEMGKVAKDSKKGLDAVTDAAIDKGADLLEGMNGINKANAFKSIEDLIAGDL